MHISKGKNKSKRKKYIVNRESGTPFIAYSHMKCTLFILKHQIDAAIEIQSVLKYEKQ